MIIARLKIPTLLTSSKSEEKLIEPEEVAASWLPAGVAQQEHNNQT